MNDLVNVLGKDILTKTTRKVPFIKGAVVVFYDDVTGDFVDQLDKKTEDEGETESGYWFALETIVSWNFSDENGKALPKTRASFKKLPMKLQRWIFEQSQYALLSDKDKKKG